MKRASRYIVWSAVLLGVVVVAQAQQAAPPPPPVLRIFEENVKVGKVPAHEKLESSWTKMWAAQKYPGQSLAMKTTSQS